MPITPGLLESKAQTRERFLGNLLAITGDTRLLWQPKGGDTTSSTDESVNVATLTPEATMAGQIVGVGNGYARTFGGASNLTTPDRADLSFGNGTVDQAVTFLALANVTDTAASRAFIAKFTASNNEYIFQVSASDTLQLLCYDNSAAVSMFRTSNSAITQGSVHLFGATYSGAGGASAANGIVLYQDGQVIASTATNNASYVAMENLAAGIEIGSITGGAASLFSGNMGLVALVAGALTTSQMWALYKLCKGLFNV